MTAPPAPVCEHTRITEGRCEACGKNVMPHFNAPPAPFRDLTKEEGEAYGKLVDEAFTPPAPVCEKCGHMEHPDGECCWPLRRGPAGYVHKHCNCGGKRTPTPAPDRWCPTCCRNGCICKHPPAPDDEMRPEYDFREGERGKYFERYNAPPPPERMPDEEFERFARHDPMTFMFPSQWRVLYAEARRARESEAALLKVADEWRAWTATKDAEIRMLKVQLMGLAKIIDDCDCHNNKGRDLIDEATARAEKAEAEVAALKFQRDWEANMRVDAETRASDAQIKVDDLTAEAIRSDEKFDTLNAEVERLKDERDYWRGRAASEAHGADRLRAALREIVETVRDPRLIAREALEGKP